MKIALFSDIHANLPALDAVLKHLRGESPDMTFCLGDLVGYAPWPNEVVERLRETSIPTLAGNYDRGVGNGSDDCGCAYRTEADRERGAASIAWTNEAILPENRSYLAGLPSHIRLESGSISEATEQAEGDSPAGDLLLVHGSPRRINEYLYEDRPDRSLLRMMEEAGACLMAFGHTHKPWHRVLETPGGGFRHAVNIGSVGKPKDGDPRACYATLQWEGAYPVRHPGDLEVRFHRVDYPVEEAARAVEDSPLPDDFAGMLREAR